MQISKSMMIIKIKSNRERLSAIYSNSLIFNKSNSVLIILCNIAPLLLIKNLIVFEKWAEPIF